MKSNLKRLRKEAGLTLQDVAKKCGFVRSHIHHLENEKSNPTLSAAYTISNAIGHKVEDVWPNNPDELYPNIVDHE